MRSETKRIPQLEKESVFPPVRPRCWQIHVSHGQDQPRGWLLLPPALIAILSLAKTSILPGLVLVLAVTVLPVLSVS